MAEQIDVGAHAIRVDAPLFRRIPIIGKSDSNGDAHAATAHGGMDERANPLFDTGAEVGNRQIAIELFSIDRRDFDFCADAVLFGNGATESGH